jgi:hypothetical protein
LVEAKSFKKASEKELEKLMIELHSCQLELQKAKQSVQQQANSSVSYASYASSFLSNSPNSSSNSSTNSSYLSEENVNSIQKKLEEELKRRFSIDENHIYNINLLKEDVAQLNKENKILKEQIVNLSSEIYGARLAAKYLDKELAGRIQQIQLFDKNLKVY